MEPTFMQNRRSKFRSFAGIYKELNSVYVASDNLKGTSLKGSGTLLYDDSLRLTMPGYNKSIWELPAYFSDPGISISRHGKRDRFRKTGDAKKTLLTTVGIGQDFVIDDPCGTVEEWAKRIVEKSVSVV